MVRNNVSDITGFIPQVITLNGVSCSIVLTVSHLAQRSACVLPLQTLQI